MPHSFIDYLTVFTFIGAIISFGIKVFTGRSSEEVFYEVVHHSTSAQSHTTSHSHDNSASQGSARVYPPTYAQSTSTTVTTQQTLTRWSWRRLIAHPRLFWISLLGLLLIIVSITLSASGRTPLAFTITDSVGTLFYLTAWISTIVITAKEKKWIWLIVVILTAGYGVIFFSILDRPKKPVVVSSMGMADSPVKPNAI